ncbi:DUF1707 SHOCT-like domain-containing protein [Actinomadura scrupuli]|uniref:DUF1707 SHOCT-like domain-containing protein n=1 Tax=Actinomadura scrupuli TaxID=559629 RepID=UPI003D96B5D4
MTNVPERANPPDPRGMRASDADRDRVAEVLRQAAGDGRLGLDELDDRLSAVYAAKTYAELEPITRDLPIGGAPETRTTDRIGGVPTSRFAVAVMSGFQRVGRWTLPGRFTAIAFWGGGKLDLREARFAEAETRIRVFAVMGGVEIVVPEDLEVHVTGIGIMGGFDHKAGGAGAPGSPRVIISGLAFWGGVGTSRRARKKAKRELRDGQPAE